MSAEEDAEVDYTPEMLEIEPGTLVIPDYVEFLTATKSLAIHLTDEGSVFLMDQSGEHWKSLPVSAGNKKPAHIRPV